MPERHEDGQHHAIRSIARFLLQERLDQLTTTALERLEREEDAYPGVIRDPAVRRSGMRRTLELALSRLAYDDVPSRILRATQDVGRERAEQGFPLPALIHSFQLDLRTLWEAVLSEARSRGLGSDPDFLDGLILVWEATDANSVEVVEAYSRRQRDLADHRYELRARAFARLVLDGERDLAAVTEASSALGISEDTSLLVVLAEGVPTGEAVLDRCRRQLQRTNLPFYLGWMGSELVGVIDPGHRTPAAVTQLLEPLSEWRCGVARVDQLAATARGLRLARAAARGALGPGLRPIDAHWAGALMSAHDELAAAVAHELLLPLMRLRERDGILETLSSYLELGSIAGVAEQTFRHRNTIRNRLRLVEEVTGLDLSRPRDTTQLYLSLQWLSTAGGSRFRAACDRGLADS